MDKCDNCKRKCTLKKCNECPLKLCILCSYCEMHDCPNTNYEIERDMNRFKEKIQTINT